MSKPGSTVIVRPPPHHGISRQTLRNLWLAIGLGIVGCLSLTASAEADSPPNIVLILSDDQSWTDYGFMGHDQIETPNLDRLAANSAVFKRGYVPTALCRPSLATLATGLYAHQHKISGNDPSPTTAKKNSPEYKELQAQLISQIDRQPTLPKLLAKKGYLSHQSGKWWEGSFQRGGFTHGMTRGFPERGGRHGDDGLKIGREGMKPVFDFVDHSIEEEKPFFLWYAPFLPHTPHDAPARLYEKYKAKGVESDFVARYYANCEWFDETCGQLIDFIDERGLTNSTVYYYISDNGWIQSTDTKKYALRSKQSPYEGGTRQPTMISWQGVIEPGERTDIVSSIDFVPTMLGVAGAEIPTSLPGINLIPVARDGQPTGREIIFGEGCAHDIADIEDPSKSLLYRWCIRGDWKLLLTYDGAVNRYNSSHPRTERRPQLFNLKNDPHENKNLAKANPDLVAELVQEISEWYPVSGRKVLTKWED